MPAFQVKLSLPDFNSPDVPFELDCEPTSIRELALLLLEHIGGFSHDEIQRIDADKLPLRLFGELRDDLLELSSDAQMRVFLATAGDRPIVIVRPVDQPFIPSVSKEEIFLKSADELWERLSRGTDTVFDLPELTRVLSVPAPIVARSFSFAVSDAPFPLQERIGKAQFVACVQYLQYFLQLQCVLDNCLGTTSSGDRRVTAADFFILVPKINEVGFEAEPEDFGRISKGQQSLFVEELCDGLVTQHLRPTVNLVSTLVESGCTETVFERERGAAKERGLASEREKGLDNSERELPSVSSVVHTTATCEPNIPENVTPYKTPMPRGRPPIPGYRPSARKSSSSHLSSTPRSPAMSTPPRARPVKAPTLDEPSMPERPRTPSRRVDEQRMLQLYSDSERREQKLVAEREKTRVRESEAFQAKSEAILARSKRDVVNYVPPQCRYFQDQLDRERRRTEAQQKRESIERASMSPLQSHASVPRRPGAVPGAVPVHERLYQEQQQRTQRQEARMSEHVRVEMAECQPVPRVNRQSLKSLSPAPSAGSVASAGSGRLNAAKLWENEANSTVSSSACRTTHPWQPEAESYPAHGPSPAQYSPKPRVESRSIWSQSKAKDPTHRASVTRGRKTIGSNVPRASSFDQDRLQDAQEPSTQSLESRLAFMEELHRSALVQLRRTRDECETAYTLLNIERGKVEAMEHAFRSR